MITYPDIRSILPDREIVEGEPCAVSQTGEGYVTFHIKAKGHVDALAALTRSIQSYADGRSGPVYIRKHPEIERGHAYCRLLISDKPVIAAKEAA